MPCTRVINFATFLRRPWQNNVNWNNREVPHDVFVGVAVVVAQSPFFVGPRRSRENERKSREQNGTRSIPSLVPILLAASTRETNPQQNR